MAIKKLFSHDCPHHCRELELFESMPYEGHDVVSWYCPECRQVFTFLSPAEEWPDDDDGLGGE